jgi:hypothetical protein
MNPNPDSAPFPLQLQQQHGPDLRLHHLVNADRMGRLPLPGGGNTLARWRQLAAVAAIDLSLVKLFEGHTDALAILAELGGPAPVEGSRWGTWCAEPPDARLEFRPAGGNPASLRISGTKAWCSGAASVTHALVSGWNAAGEPCLAAVAMDQPGVTVTGSGWHAVGMAGSGSVDVQFADAIGEAVGAPGDYTARPGFWQGGIGVAACWFGGATALADMTLARSVGSTDAHRLAHLGAIDVALAGAAAVLRESAAAIDAHPLASAHGLATRCRLVVEAACETVLRESTRALGAGPLCRDERFARLAADLPVYVRQSHAQRDLAGLGSVLAAAFSTLSWQL